MNIKRIIKKGFQVLEWTLFILLLVVLFLVASPLLPTKKYVSTYVVSTGSMEPTIKTGSVVFSSQEESLVKGDIIVFTSPLDSKTSIIHRISNITTAQDGSILYSTKGDHNENEDNWKVSNTEIKGKLFLTVPYLGYVIDWMKTPLGFIIVLGVPAILLLISQIKKIKEGINEEVEKRTKEEIEKIKSDSTKSTITTLIAILAFTVCLFNVNTAYALFSAKVNITGITLSTGIPQSVIINEVMWAGSSVSQGDQWIELRNTTDKDIDIGQWRIENARDTGKPSLMIPASKVISANGYFLISSYPQQSKNTELAVNVDMSNASITLLVANNGNLVLKDSDGNIIDQALGNPQWAAGLTGNSFHSMERKAIPGDGLDQNNWESCLSILCTNSQYWKTLGEVNYGTPGFPNIYGL